MESACAVRVQSECDKLQSECRVQCAAQDASLKAAVSDIASLLDDHFRALPTVSADEENALLAELSRCTLDANSPTLISTQATEQTDNAQHNNALQEIQRAVALVAIEEQQAIDETRRQVGELQEKIEESKSDSSAHTSSSQNALVITDSIVAALLPVVASLNT